MEPESIEDISLTQALAMCALVLEPEKWIHRRVEQVSYLDHKTVRRRITVDFDVPELGFDAGDVLYLPIAQFAKQKLVNFDMCDADGRALTMLTAEQNGRLSTALLSAFASLHGKDQIDSVTERFISVLVHAVTEEDRALAWSRIFQSGTTVGERLAQRTAFVKVATDLRTNFILYLPVAANDVGVRKLVKIAFDAPRTSVKRTGLRVRLGWQPADDRFQIPLAGYCASYHFELEAPLEMEIVDGSFIATRDGRTVKDLLGSPTRRAHFNLSRLDPAHGSIAVRLRARSSMLSGAALLSVINVAALWFILLRIHNFVEVNSGDSLVAALIAIPGLLVGYVTRPTEHAMVTSFLADIRFVALLSGLTSFAGAFVLLAGYSEDKLFVIFLTISIVATAASLLLAASWLLGRARQ